MDIRFRSLRPEDYALSETFKRATVVDAAGREDLFDVWFPPERSFAAFLRELQAFDPASCAQMLVDGAVVGEITLNLMKDGRGKLNNIYLRPEWRGKKLGDAMDAYAMAFFRRHGITEAALRTNPANTKLVGFYLRMGWQMGAMSDHGMVWMTKAVG